MEEMTQAVAKRAQERVEALKKEFRELSLAAARERADDLSSRELEEVASYLRGQGEYILRLAAYLEKRDLHAHEGAMKAHVAGVKRQNEVGRIVRRAFGFSYPKSGDVSF